MIIVGKGEYAVQCSVVEHGVQCNNGSRLLKARICNKHLGRLRRTGTVYKITLEEQRRQQKELKRIQEGRSIICTCTHKFSEHKRLPKNGGNQRSKQTDKCMMENCKCWSFSGVNVELADKILPKLRRMGFHPINKNILCLRCNEYVDAGWWYD